MRRFFSFFMSFAIFVTSVGPVFAQDGSTSTYLPAVPNADGSGRLESSDDQPPAPDVTISRYPTSEVDGLAVPHYYGPYPNWANSPYTLADVAVVITGDGTGATTVASVGADVVVTDIVIANPGSGYTSAGVSFTGAGTGATADAVVNLSGSVTGITVDAAGSGYITPNVTISGGGATTDATATAYGGVAAVTLVGNGSGYTIPTVDFDLPDGPDGIQARAHAVWDTNTGVISAIVVDNPGSGYSSAPNVVIRDGTIFKSIYHDPATTAAASSTLAISAVNVDTYGAGYTSAPAVTITDAGGSGSGSVATASTDFGAITAINLTAGGTGYLTAGGIKKFQDGLPMLCDPSVAGSCVPNNLGQYLPLGVPDTTTFSKANGFDLDADYYVIALVQHREQMNSSLPITGTLLREYVQLETQANLGWSKHVALQTDLLDGTSVPTLMPDGTQAIAVDDPHYLGPVIVANKDRPVRIVFYNLLPNGADGDLFIPTDSTMMGSGSGPMTMSDPTVNGTVTDGARNPNCTQSPDNSPKSNDCFKDNRATLHLHGGITPWISDGTPHQWITPANENTPYPQGVSVGAVPDMAAVPGVPDCTGERDGCLTFYYTNQQSARLMFYHDHAWGITRLNVYAGEAAGYLITDDTESKLMAAGGPLADVGLGIPLIIQDRTFVPSTAQLAQQDPTWDYSR